MSSDYEKLLETEVDRELKTLPELTAPSSLMLRVNAAIKTAQIPWYRQSWQTWPTPLQAAFLVVLMAAFAALCFGSWKLSQAQSFAAVLQRPTQWLSAIGTLGHAFNVILSSLGLAIRSLSTGVLIGLIAALVLGYAMCVGLGTIYYRVALARR